MNVYVSTCVCTVGVQALIQAVCRWATQDALKVYARLEASVSEVVKQASRVDFTSTQVANLPLLVKEASRADISSVRAEDVPDIDNDAKWRQADTHTEKSFEAVQQDGDNIAHDDD